MPTPEVEHSQSISYADYDDEGKLFRGKIARGEVHLKNLSRGVGKVANFFSSVKYKSTISSFRKHVDATFNRSCYAVN